MFSPMYASNARENIGKDGGMDNVIVEECKGDLKLPDDDPSERIGPNNQAKKDVEMDVK